MSVTQQSQDVISLSASFSLLLGVPVHRQGVRLPCMEGLGSGHRESVFQGTVRVASSQMDPSVMSELL